MPIKDQHNPKSTIHLGSRSVKPLRKVLPGLTLVCDSGVLWVTQVGDHDDYIMYSGDQLVVSNRGKVLVEAMCEAELHLA